jgi:hypothetical protein
MTRRTTAILQVGIGVVVLGFMIRAVSGEWTKIQDANVALAFRPGWIALSMVITWLMYAGLIEGWLRVIRGWGEEVRWLTGARIWILASFGKYLPGRIWAIAGLAVMSERAGVRGGVATAASVVMQVLAVGTGVAVAAMTIGRELESVQPGAGMAMLLLGLAALGSLVTVGHQGTLNRIWRIARREGPPPSAPRAGALGEGIALNLIAWLGYGIAFWALAHGVLPGSPLDPRLAIGGFAAAYLAGLLAIFVPGGLLVREAMLVALFQGSIGLGEAVILAAVSRLVLTGCEVGAALPFLFKRESPA